MEPLWIAFLTGLTTGGLSCLAVQGGLLTASIPQKIQQPPEGIIQPNTRFYSVAFFLIAKIISHTLLGFALGLVGSSFVLTPKIMGLLQIAVGIYLFATAARIADIHPIFRYTVIKPPIWTYRFLKHQSRDTSWFAPGLLGFFTVLMPCGVTQAMMVAAVAAANPWMSAGIMAAFVIGTSPVFFLLGIAVVEVLKRKVFAYSAAILVALFAVLSINGGMALRGSVYTLQNFYRAATMDVDALVFAKGDIAGISDDGKQDVKIFVASNGYHSSATALKVDVPVRLSLITNRTKGCSRAFTIPEYGISKILPDTGTETIEFTPRKTGTLAFACSMGMYTGSFSVIP